MDSIRPDSRALGRTGSAAEPDPVTDLELTRAVIGGSLPAWHEFVHRYSGLIFGVIRRQLFREDEDDIRALYVEVLESLYRGGLEKYGGRSSLATWLIVYSRNRALDLLRKQFGRKRAPRWQDDLDEVQRMVLDLLFGENLPLDVVVQQLAWRGHDLTSEEVANLAAELKAMAPPEFRARLARSQRPDGPSRRRSDLYAFLQQLRWEIEESAGDGDPHSRLESGRRQEILDRVRRAMRELPPRQRSALHLRFFGGLTAPQIAKRMKLERPREVYSIIDRALAQMRQMLANLEDMI